MFRYSCFIFICLGVYHQYDTIIYPDQTQPKTHQLELGNITGSKFRPEPTPVMRKICLEAYLSKKRKLLVNCYETLIETMDIGECMDEIMSIYTSLSCQLVYCVETGVLHWNEEKLQEVGNFSSLPHFFIPLLSFVLFYLSPFIPALPLSLHSLSCILQVIANTSF